MGRKTRTIRFVAFVIGPACLDERDALLAALDKPGEGELIHPWYGRMKVTATSDCTASHSWDEGGVVRFELVFVEAVNSVSRSRRPIPRSKCRRLQSRSRILH
jgi:prophage DNA circulation protein